MTAFLSVDHKGNDGEGVTLSIDSVRIGVVDLESASAAYALLLGTPAVGAATRRFQLDRGAVELALGEPGLHSLCFVSDTPDEPPLPPSCNGIPLRVAAGSPRVAASDRAAPAIDHVVVQTLDPEGAIAFWRDRAGVRLALDRPFPERGLRLLFFRSGGITLEYASPHPAAAERDTPDRFHGLSYRVTDLPAYRERLVGAGLDVSPVRPGMRPGTRVATVRSGTAGVPTLLLEVVAP